MADPDLMLIAISNMKEEGATEEEIKQAFDDCLAVYFTEMSMQANEDCICPPKGRRYFKCPVHGKKARQEADAELNNLIKED